MLFRRARSQSVARTQTGVTRAVPAQTAVQKAQQAAQQDGEKRQAALDRVIKIHRQRCAEQLDFLKEIAAWIDANNLWLKVAMVDGLSFPMSNLSFLGSRSYTVILRPSGPTSITTKTQFAGGFSSTGYSESDEGFWLCLERITVADLLEHVNKYARQRNIPPPA
ncbi:MAG: hypothetical protein JWN38_100 [Candidatus Saccharibacteria bacterium]|nr:hypothetical protein [Candidatus Saccharibacteria bacterium]